MTRAVPLWLALAGLGASLACAARAEAQDSAAVVPVRIRYDVVAGCPGEPEFLAQLQARAPRVRLAAPDEEAATFDVSVAPERGRLVGRFVLEESRRSSRPSQVTARSCDDVLAALALIAALSIDPRASAAAPGTLPAAPHGPANTAPPSAATTPATPLSAAPPIQAPTTTAPEPAAVAAPAPAGLPEPTLGAQPTGPARDRSSPAVPPPPAPKRTFPHLSSGLDLDSVYAGVPVFARLGAHVRAGWSGGFSLGLGVSASQGSLDQTQGGASLQWMTATVEACAFRVPLGAALSVVPCIPLEGGIFSVTGTGVPNPVTQQRPWFTVGGLARLELRLGARFHVDAHAGLGAPLVRDTFYFLPNSDVFRPAAVIGWGGLGAGVRFL